MIIIGIDPAFRKTGFAAAIIDETGEVEGRMFQGLLEFIQWVESREWPGQPVIVGVDNSNLQNKTFDMRGTKGEIARRSRNAGANQAASQYTVDYCCHFFGEKYVFGISPKDKGGKWTQAQFRAVLAQERHRAAGKFNQDQRDAYKIALIARKRASFRAAKLTTWTN